MKILNMWKSKKNEVPVHVAIIMDGNGRWATRKKLPRIFGHKAGVEALREAVMTGIELGIKYLTVYSFSTENWQRPREEVEALMNLFVEALENELDSLHRNGVRILMIGRRENIPREVLNAFENAEEKTRNNDRLFLNIAFNYGSRQEIIDAVKKICVSVQKNELKLDELDEKLFSRFLYTGSFPDPDLLIRTGGEYRLSNFLLWQSGYTEFYFTRTLWPDFKRKDFLEAIEDYQRRERKFGRI